MSRRKLIREHLKQEWGKPRREDSGIDSPRNRMDRIRIYHQEREQSGESKTDEVTWNDLEMDEVFFRLNHTKCYIGEQVLYHRLHMLDARRDWDRWERQIRYCTVHEKERMEMEERLFLIGKKEENYRLPTFLMHPEYCVIHNGFGLHVLQVLLIGFFLLCIFANHPAFAAGLILTAVVNLFVYLAAKHKYEGYLDALGSLKQLLQFSKRILSNAEWKELFATEEAAEAYQELKRLTKSIVNWQERRYAGISGDFMYILQEYVFGITLYDITAFNHIMKMIDRKQDKVLILYEFAGEVDMAISTASYRACGVKWCQPQFWTKHEICGEGIIHPLIDGAVENDFSLCGRAIVTGANASGKSTFMKALAVNAILAQTIHTCTAESFCLPELSVMTSMSIRDDTITGESYYIREAKYLKRMLDRVREEDAVLVVIDEILKGTNTTERLAASAAILDYFARRKCFVLVATHDMELVYSMKGKYENYYFESQVKEQDIAFDYRIHEGVGGSSNAIALLSLLHYPQEILASAHNNMMPGAKGASPQLRL